jgi:hypothetical protein
MMHRRPRVTRSSDAFFEKGKMIAQRIAHDVPREFERKIAIHREDGKTVQELSVNSD